MAIRITGYSQSPVPSGSTIHPLPTIHVEGESIGSDRSQYDVRRVKGTVGMIGDGAIRWSLVSRTLFFASCCYTVGITYSPTCKSLFADHPRSMSIVSRVCWCVFLHFQPYYLLLLHSLLHACRDSLSHKPHGFPSRACRISFDSRLLTYSACSR